MTTQEKAKIETLLLRHYTTPMTKCMLDMIKDKEQTVADIDLMDKRAFLISSTDGGKTPVPNAFCPHCGSPLYAETELEIDYPYVCRECDENFYSFEVDFDSDTAMKFIDYQRQFHNIVDLCKNRIFNMFRMADSNGFVFDEKLVYTVYDGNGVFNSHTFKSCEFLPKSKNCIIDRVYLIDADNDTMYDIHAMAESDLVEFYGIVYDHFNKLNK